MCTRADCICIVLEGRGHPLITEIENPCMNSFFLKPGSAWEIYRKTPGKGT